MKHKIVRIGICMVIMIVTAFPVISFPIQTGKVNSSNFVQPQYQTPTPGYAPLQPSSTIKGTPRVSDYPKKTAVTMNDVVVSILQQVNETIYARYLENLTAFGPRVTGTNSCEAAAGYIYDQFDSMGLAVRYHHWSNGGYTSDNVEATITGTNESSNEIYIICAHYDTVSSSPGADDDASGTVAVLMAAFVMSHYQYKFNHTIKFVAFSGEEQGLLGSEVYAAEAADNAWNIVGVLNADMISYAETITDERNLIVFENDASEWLYNYTLGISTEYAEYIHLTLHEGGYTWGSDHHSFWSEGYNALFCFEYTETPYYHTSNDTIAHINPAYAVKNIRLLLAALAELSESRFLSNPPAKPVLIGPAKGVINQVYNLSVVAIEPEGEDVYYFIEWGDGQVDGWMGPYKSGVTVEITHRWEEKGTYTILAKAKDIHEMESDWGTLKVSMPKTYENPFHQLIERLFERFFNTIFKINI